MPLEILPATPADLDRILPFMASLYGQDNLNYDPTRARRLSEWLLATPDAGAIFLLRIDGADAGYVVLTVCVSLEFHGRFALLDELYLDTPYRNRGLGPEAVQFACAWARSHGMAAVRLETAKNNDHAIHVYKKAGFHLHSRYLMTKWV